jgi:SLOG cluster2
MAAQPLKDLTVFVSASVPDAYVGTNRASDLFNLLGGLIRCVLDGGGGVVFGGHPSLVIYAHAVALKAGSDNGGIHIYQLRRFYQNPVRSALVEQMLKLEGRTDVAIGRPLGLEDSSAFRSVEWIPVLEGGREAELEQMRRAMAERSQAAIFGGGRTTGFHGVKPGILQEYEIFREVHRGRPEAVYLTGILDGTTLDLISENERNGVTEPNTLEPGQLAKVRRSDNPDLVCGLIMADLVRFAAKLTSDRTITPATPAMASKRPRRKHRVK